MRAHNLEPSLLLHDPPHQLLVLFGLQAAGRVDHPSPRPDTAQCHPQEPRLDLRQLVQIAGLQPPPHLGPLPQHSGVRAGNIQQNRIETDHGQLLGLPPQQLAPHNPQAQSPTRLGHPGEPGDVDIDRHNLPLVLHQLGQVGCFATGGRAEIEHPFPGPGGQQAGRRHGRFILHGEPAIREPGKFGHPRRAFEHDRFRLLARLSSHAPLPECLEQGVAGGSQRVGAERQPGGGIEPEPEGPEVFGREAAGPPADQPGGEAEGSGEVVGGVRDRVGEWRLLEQAIAALVVGDGIGRGPALVLLGQVASE